MFDDASFDRWGCLWCNEILGIIGITAQDPPEEFPHDSLPEELRPTTGSSPWKGWAVWDFWHAKILHRIRVWCHISGEEGLLCMPVRNLGMDTAAFSINELKELNGNV